jgi:hypothetical protein
VFRFALATTTEGRTMKISRKHKVAIGVAAALAVGGGGAAVAADQLGSPREEREAILNDAAKELGVEPGALSDALEKALMNRVDAWVEAGRVTEEQGEALKERIEAGDLPLFGPGGLGHHGGFGHVAQLDAAAEYLGVSEDELREVLEDGKTLAQIARDQDKSVDGLIDALLVEAKEKIDEAREEGRLSDADADRILADMKERITALVNGERGRGFRLSPSFEPGFHGFAPRFDVGPTA